MTHFPELKTQRLILRKINKKDDKRIFQLRSNVQSNQYLERVLETTIEESCAFISMILCGIEKGQWLYWAIEYKNKPGLVGTVCLWNFSENNTIAELGFELISDHHGQGLMSETLMSVINFSFQKLALKKIFANTHKENKPALHLLGKLGFSISQMSISDQNRNFTTLFLDQQNYKPPEIDKFAHRHN